MFQKNLIYHCSSFNVGQGGGVESYLGYLLEHELPGVSNQAVKLIEDINQSQCQLLHLHSVDLLLHLTGECPSVFTVHNHSLYCPSGTKYLAEQQVICPRNFSYLGCTWGKLVDGCGSRRPLRALNEFQHCQELSTVLKKLRVILIANSEYIREQLIKNGIPPERTVTLHSGISVPKNATAPLSLETHQKQRILFAGRIVPDKGLEWLIDTLVETDEQIHLDIAGEGWDRPRLERLASKLGLNNRITWHGWCDRSQLNSLDEECFAVIFPSVWPEPAGLVTLEAYAHYRPVIASQVGGIPEYLEDGETGILVPANDIKKLSQAISELHKDYQKCRLIGEKGHALLMQKFTMDVHIKNLQKIYENTISEFSSPY